MTRKAPSPRIALLTAIVLILALVPTALADKGGTRNGGNKRSSDPPTLNLVLLDSTDGLPHYGQTVTFDVSTSASYPGVTLNCYQNESLVSTQTNGMWWPSPDFFLWSGAWTGGAADCTAVLFSGTTTLATKSFHVYA